VARAGGARLSADRARLLLKLALLACGVWLTNHFIAARLAYFLDFDLWFALAAYLGIWAAAAAALLYVAFTPLAGVRLFWSVLIGLSTLVADSYFQVVGNRLTIEVLDAMWDPDMVNADTVAFYGRQAARAVLATAVLLGGLLIRPPRIALLRGRALAFLPLLPMGLVGGVIVYSAASGGEETRGLPSQFHDLGLFALYALSPDAEPDKSEVAIPLNGRPAARHIVLIVDESISGDFIDLNVPRGTTPYLASSPAGLVNFGLATAAGNCSNTSNAVLRLGAKPELLGAGDYSPLANPSVWKYARGAGYQTNYISAKYLTDTGQNYMNPAELALIDHVLSVPAAVRVASRDGEILELLAQVLARPAPQFVYVNKQGAHFPYHRFTPESEARFRPVMQPREPVADRERLVNSYKNAVYRAVDRFFAELLPRVDLAETVILYTSDHGQNLLDDGTPVTHCRRSRQNLYEVVVPLLAWAGDDALRQRFERAASANFGAASHFEIFPTLLVLFGYDPGSVRERYRQSLFEVIEQPLGYVSGPISGRFGWQPAWHSRAGIERLDR
jgi:glucan phosphoethanolaminetransferase (alkaline phosphatase superfamily)